VQELDDPIPISALQHAVYCLRQAALIHIERQWEENRFTAEGRVLHDVAHDPADRKRGGIRRVDVTAAGVPAAQPHGCCRSRRVPRAPASMARPPIRSSTSAAGPSCIALMKCNSVRRGFAWKR
jgi:hypothetical protein